ncbi:hypothetical protein BMAJHU_I1246, partial [Burkholderia mallei JHU]
SSYGLRFVPVRPVAAPILGANVLGQHPVVAFDVEVRAQQRFVVVLHAALAAAQAALVALLPAHRATAADRPSLISSLHRVSP